MTGKSAGEDLNLPGSGDVTASERRTAAEEAFEEFVKQRYSRLIGTVTVIVRDRATAEDIVQETFAKAYLSWGKLWPEGNPAGWVHRVAVNLAMSWHRKASRELRAVARLGRRAEVQVSEPEIHPELVQAVGRLPARQRTAVALHYTLGLPVDETAAAMGCRPGTVKSLLYAARQRLREELQEP